MKFPNMKICCLQDLRKENADMCRISTREQLETQADINSLVVGLINRQCKPFSEEMIIKLTEYHSSNAKVIITRKQIMELIRSRLDTCERNGFLSYKKGYYYPKSIINLI